MKEIEIYIHIPFCVRKCGYCDFVSAPASDETKRNYATALLKEISLCLADPNDIVSSVFIGGGTPSVMPPEDISRILQKLREKFPFTCDAEISMEANPGTVTAESLSIYKEAGINRISFGLQSCDNHELKLLGRIHTFEEFLHSFHAAREAGFDNINIDIMSALPGQSPESFRETLRKVIALEPEHISAYSLIIEEGTPFYEKFHEEDEVRAQGGAKTGLLPTEEDEREMYHDTIRILGQAGYEHYEISNYAKPGYACRHNIGYWTGVPYLGFGLAASSYYNNVRYSNTAQLDEYMFSLSLQSTDTHSASVSRMSEESAIPEISENMTKRIRKIEEEVTKERAMEEFMFLGLRMMRGVSSEEFLQRFGADIQKIYGRVLEKMISEGLLGIADGRYFLTERGLDLANYVCAEFLL